MTQIKLPVVMLVDDELPVLEALERDLRGRFQIVTCKGLLEAVRALESIPDIKIILTDESLGPNESGVDLLRWAQEHRPLVVRCLISGRLDADEITRLLGAGVYHRFFFKPWDATTLTIQLKECVVLSDFLKDSRLDPLTNLMNRRGFEEHLSKEIERAQRHSRSLSLVMFDLDNLKSVNDLSGHPKGDEYLRNFASFLKLSLRNIDYLARLGGDEFGVLLPDTSETDALKVIQRMMSKAPADLQFSAGLAQLRLPTEDFTSFIKRADDALYQAKRQGKNQVQVAGR